MLTNRRTPPRARSRALVSGCLITIILGACDRAPRPVSPPASSPPESPAPAGAHPGANPHLFRSEPLPERTDRAGAPLFVRLAGDETGVAHVPRLAPSGHPLAHLNHTAFIAGGVAIADFDGDGRQDLFFTSGPEGNRLYLQTEPLRFTERSDDVAGGDAWGVGAAAVDIDGDGDQDIYVANYDAPNQLFLGDGRGHFAEAAAEHGLAVRDACLWPTFADYDRDGDLDCHVLTYRYYRAEGRPTEPPVGKRDGQPYILPGYERYYALRQTGEKSFTMDECGRPDRLLRNDDGRFVDITEAAGLGAAGHGLSATWWDANDDGLLDLYVANDFTDPDHLWENRGDGTFVDVTADVLPYTTWSSMGADAGDLDGDGRLDLLVADMAATTHFKAKVTMGEMGDRQWFLENAWPRQTMRNAAFLATGTKRFLEVAFLAGLARTDWTWAVKIADFDEDGLADVFTTNGMSRMSNDADVPVRPERLIGHSEWDIWKDQAKLEEQNLAFRGAGDLSFVDASREWGLDLVGMSFAAAHADLDGDGDLDLVVQNLDAAPAIYLSGASEHHRAVVKLEGRAKNRDAIGARITVTLPSGRRLVREIVPAHGYLSSNEPAAFLGLGREERIADLAVRWPDGTEASWKDLAADRRYTIRQADVASAADRAAPAPSAHAPLLVEAAAALGLEHRHVERRFDDFARQPLLPAKHSQLGPGLAWGDVDADGRDDLFIGGAAGTPGRLFLAAAGGKFSPAQVPSLDAHADREDMAALFFDADADGDVDLFVASGGVECEEDDARLEDRLYLGDGAGGFTLATTGLPSLRSSSGAATLLDVDADGDLDIFVGGRVVPGRYPESPESRLLLNEDGTFVDATDTIAPELRRVGMVTAALASDVEADGDVDLLVALEWGAVHLFASEGGRLVDRTAEAGLAERTGWWSGLAAGDVDLDGDIDLVALNVGLNTKYGAASPKKPALLFAGDMDGSGKDQIIEAKPGAEGLLPVRGRSCSSAAMPSLRERFPTFRSFASSLLDDIYTPERIERAQRLEANEFRSGILENDGAGHFEFRPLPRLSQASPGYGAAVVDLDGDGAQEIWIAQNLYTREPETGLWRGGIGAAIRVKSGGELKWLEAVDTGFIAAGDAKGLAVSDLDGDGWPDLAVTQNDDRLLVFRRRMSTTAASSGARAPLRVTLRGPRGNARGIGARVVAELEGGGRVAAEVRAGEGWLSQSAADVWLPRPEAGIARVVVRWPDGARSEAAPEGDGAMSIAHPGER